MSMNLTIKATNIDLTDAIRSYVEKRLCTLKKHVDATAGDNFAEIEVGKTTEHHHQGNIFRAEIVLHINGKKVVAVSEKDDLYAAIDEMKDKIEREVTSGKERSRALWRKGASAVKKILRRN